MGGMEKLAEASVQLEELNKLLVVQKKAVEGRNQWQYNSTVFHATFS